MDDGMESRVRARLPQDARREQLIDAAITAIAEHGLSNVTLSKVASLAGLTAGMVNFHFKSKQDLLQATLARMAEAYRSLCESAVAAAGQEPDQALMALVRASFDPQVASLERLAVWYAFWGESRARDDYMALVASSDRAFYEAVHALMAELAERAGARIELRAAALGLCGLVDALSQEALVQREAFDWDDAVDTCRHYLANLFPQEFAAPARLRLVAEAESDAPALPPTLPGWTYADPGIHAAEVARIHRPAWQLVAHVSELPAPGDYVTFEALGERAFVIRGEDGGVRAFHNVCRHRAHAVLQGRDGHCSGLIRCPYHAWCYAWDGRLRAVAAAKTFPEIDTAGLGLLPLDCEVFSGFVFLRFESGGPSVAERYAPYAAELAAHRIEEMVPITDYWIGEIDADWKNVWDNYLEDYHFPTGHPGLFGLMSGAYDREPDDATRTIRLSHALRREPDGGWSTRAYARLLPDVPHLPEVLKRRWTYLFLYPGVSLELYPDMLDYFHILPAGPGRSILRWRAYARPDDRRAMQLTRRLNLRVNNRVHDEDAALIRSVQQGLSGSAYGSGVLGEKEINLRAFQGWIRRDVPEAGQLR